jgi:tetratricopeptide (TPR) repeat protein
MKAEHRKELQTNVLADKLGRFVQGLREGPSRGAVLFWGLVLAAVIVFFVVRYFIRSSEEAASELWNRWDQASSPLQLDALAKDNAGKMQARLARFELARLDMLQGVATLAWQRDEAVKKLKDAAEAYEKLADESSDTPHLAQEALLGAAKAYESLGDLDKAKGLYSRLAKTYPKSKLGGEAAARLEQMESHGPEVSAFYKEISDLAQPKKP